MHTIRCSGGPWGLRDISVRDQEADQDWDMDEVRGTGAILEALDDQTLQGRFSQRDDGVAITGMVHAKTGVRQRGYQILREPGCILELLEDRIADHIVVVVEECHCHGIEDFCEWDFCHWAVHYVDGDDKTVIIVSDLLGVRHINMRIRKYVVPGGSSRGRSNSEWLRVVGIV